LRSPREQRRHRRRHLEPGRCVLHAGRLDGRPRGHLREVVRRGRPPVPPVGRPTSGSHHLTEGERAMPALLQMIGRRLISAIILLWGVTVVTFALMTIVPGDPAAANLSQQAYDDPELRAAFE